MANNVTTDVRSGQTVRVKSSPEVSQPEQTSSKNTQDAAKPADKVSKPDAPSAPQATAQISLDDAVVELNSFVQDVRRELQFSVEKDSGKTVIKVFDQESEEIIRQIPPEEVLRMAQILKDFTTAQEDKAAALSGMILELRA